MLAKTLGMPMAIGWKWFVCVWMCGWLIWKFERWDDCSLVVVIEVLVVVWMVWNQVSGVQLRLETWKWHVHISSDDQLTVWLQIRDSRWTDFLHRGVWPVKLVQYSRFMVGWPHHWISDPFARVFAMSLCCEKSLSSYPGPAPIVINGVLGPSKPIDIGEQARQSTKD